LWFGYSLFTSDEICGIITAKKEKRGMIWKNMLGRRR
jgi:hypothetical protein